MGWHRDLRINYDELNGIYNEIKKYIDALTDLQTATSKFVSVINEQEGDAFVALSEECKDIVTVNNTDLIKTLQEVYDNLGGYMTDMQAIIAPENSAVECRVDRNDIWGNIFQIEDSICDIPFNMYVGSYSYQDEYVDPDADNADEVRARNAERRRKRENNYNKLSSFANRATSDYATDLRNEWNSINSIHENYVKVYENTDDSYALLMEYIYESIASLLDILEDSWDNFVDFAEGFGIGVIDFFKGLKAPLEMAIAFDPMLPLPLGVRAALFMDGAREIYQGLKTFIDDPEGTTEAILQGVTDTADEEGAYFTCGYAVEKVVEAFLLKKAGEKIKGPKASSAGSAGAPSDGVGDVWDMPEGGGTINGREYSQHAMERMAPDTPSVRAQLSRRAEALATKKGLQVGTPEYYEFCVKYVDPRNIPPSVIEDAIRNTPAVPGHTAGTFIHQTADVTVVINESGKVITVIPK